jgi:hypothetical protein
VPNPYGVPGGYYPGNPPVGFGTPGGLWVRLGARLIDGFGVGIVAYLLSLLLACASENALKLNKDHEGVDSGGEVTPPFTAPELTADPAWIAEPALCGARAHAVGASRGRVAAAGRLPLL